LKFGQMGNTVTPNAPIALSNVIKTLFLFRPLPYMTWSNLSVSLISPPVPFTPPVEAKRRSRCRDRSEADLSAGSVAEIPISGPERCAVK